METVAQVIIALTVIAMISGKTPLYSTALAGSTFSAITAGIPLYGSGITIQSMITSSLHPVIADMTGVLMFIGVMEATGYLNIIIRALVHFGNRFGGGAGVAAAGGITAGLIGGLTGFTQPVITASVTGPAAVRLGLSPNRTAGLISHAGALGNFAGFTHPTQVTVVATAGIAFGMINVVGLICTLTIFAVGFIRAKRSIISFSIQEDDGEKYAVHPAFAASPFLLLVSGFIFHMPVLLMGLLASCITILMSKMSFADGERAMLEGAKKVATPVVAVLSFLYMASVIKHVGAVDAIQNIAEPYLQIAPVQVLLLVSAAMGLLTQSNMASMAVTIPMLQVVLSMGVNPLAAAIAASGGSALMQYFLTGGPAAGLATVISLVPGSELRPANKFMRPSILVGLFVLFIITFIVPTKV